MGIPDLLLNPPRWLGAAIPVGAAVIATSLLVHQCNRSRDLQREIEQERERAALVAQGTPPLDQGSAKDLRARLDAEMQTSAVLRASVADAERRVREATGKPPKVVEVVKWKTQPGSATGTPRPSSNPSCPACLVAPGDRLSISVQEARLETRGGLHLLAGSARVLRESPRPETVILEAPIELTSVKGIEEKTTPPGDSPRWDAGVVGSIGTDRQWSVGPAIGYSIWRVRGSLGVTFPDQRAIGSLSVRW